MSFSFVTSALALLGTSGGSGASKCAQIRGIADALQGNCDVVNMCLGAVSAVNNFSFLSPSPLSSALLLLSLMFTMRLFHSRALTPAPFLDSALRRNDVLRFPMSYYSHSCFIIIVSSPTCRTHFKIQKCLPPRLSLFSGITISF